jgi:hypothetical protein
LYISFFSLCFFAFLPPLIIKKSQCEISTPHQSHNQIKIAHQVPTNALPTPNKTQNINPKYTKIMKTITSNFTQNPVIIQFRYAGYHQDRIEFALLLSRHRIPYQQAIDAYRFGNSIRQKHIKYGIAL